MLQKKICTIGPAEVGKTSLVARFVKQIFSDKYFSTIGVKIEKKTILVDHQDLTLLIWDLAAVDEFKRVSINYLQGASGYLLIADGTRKQTLQTAINLQAQVFNILGKTPFVLVLNKHDLVQAWQITDDEISKLMQLGWKIVTASAKSGTGVNSAFLMLARELLFEESHTRKQSMGLND